MDREDELEPEGGQPDTARIAELLRLSEQGFLSEQRFFELVLEADGVVEMLQRTVRDWSPARPLTPERRMETARAVAMLTGRDVPGAQG